MRARRGASRISLLLGAIVVVFAAAFFSLSRTSASPPRATSWTGSQPSSACSTITADDLHNELNRLGKSPAVRKQAIDAGLGPLPEPIVIPAR